MPTTAARVLDRGLARVARVSARRDARAFSTPPSTRRASLVGVALGAALATSRGDATATATTSRVTRVVVACPTGARPIDGARALVTASGDGFAVEREDEASATVRDANGFAVEFQRGDAARRGDEGDEATLRGVVIGNENPARARNAAIRRGALSAANGENCRGDAYAGCAVSSSARALEARFVKTGKPWANGSSSVVRVVLCAKDVDAVAEKIAKTLGPAALNRRGEFKATGVTEFAAEDARVASASTFLSYPTPASVAIEVSGCDRREGAFTVKAFHLALDEGCGVVYLS